MTDEPTIQNDEAQASEEEESPDQLGALQAERDELFDRLQRVAADFDNFRKRAAREQAETTTRAGRSTWSPSR